MTFTATHVDNAAAAIQAACRKVGRSYAELSEMTERLTCFGSFGIMLGEHGPYFPTLRPALNPDFAILADAYDAAREAQGDPRRAYRG